jgi:hypothetical protein
LPEHALGENLAGTVRDLLRRHADYGAFAADAVLGVEAAVARRFHPDAVGGGDPLARLVRQELFKEVQQILEEVERGGD